MSRETIQIGDKKIIKDRIVGWSGLISTQGLDYKVDLYLDSGEALTIKEFILDYNNQCESHERMEEQYKKLDNFLRTALEIDDNEAK